MKILVTGATGFLGSWMTRFLLTAGHEVVVLRRQSSDISEIEGLDIEHAFGDVTDLHSLASAAKGVDSVFHFAGLVAYKKTHRQLMEKINVQGTENVVQACIQNKVRRLVHISSVVAIGASETGNNVLNEDSEFNVSHLNLGYFETKRRAEILVKNAVSRGLLDAVVLNPSTVYGPGDARKDSRNTQLKVARGKMPFYTSGGVSVTDVNSVVQAVHTAWERGRSGERYILAGENITIKQLFEIIAECAGVQPPKIWLPNIVVRWLGGLGALMENFDLKGPLNSDSAWTAILYHWFDSSKARRELGYNPLPARKAIESSVNWMKEHKMI